MANASCVVENCKSSQFNKTPGTTFHSCPTSNELRSLWMKALKNKCYMLDWEKSKICSKHFELKFFDSNKKLKNNAVPTLFGPYKAEQAAAKNNVEKMLNKLSQAELTNDIKTSLSRMKEPTNLDVFVTDDMKPLNDAPREAKLWLLIKKQDNLNHRLMDLVVQTKKHVDILQNNMEELKAKRKEQETTIESLRYIVKCLQEKHATMEEQIEILTAVESR